VDLILDCYNACPASMEAALGMLADVAKGKGKVAILGDMLELGEFTREGHERIGEAAWRCGCRLLVLVGRHVRWAREAAIRSGFDGSAVRMYDCWEDALEYLLRAIKAGDVVLIKGSRGMMMERIAEGIEKAFGGRV